MKCGAIQLRLLILGKASENLKTNKDHYRLKLQFT